MKKYGIRIYSTMTGMECYFLGDTKEESESFLDMFKRYLEDEENDEVVENWNEFCRYNNGIKLFDDEVNDYAVGVLDNDTMVFITDGKATLFELVANYVDRF